MSPSSYNGAVDSMERIDVRPAKSIGRRAPSRPENTAEIDIIDIRHDAVETNLKEEILRSLRTRYGPKTLPTLLLYDERGLQLFEKVCD